MRTNQLFIWAMVLTLIYATSLLCNAADAPAPHRYAAASEAAPRIQFEETTYNFGQVREGTKVTHIYKFKNVGTANLILGKIQTSCGCTAALASDRDIQPGEEGKIEVTFDSKNRRGESHKTITIHTNDPDDSRVELLITGEILVEVDIVPRRLNFGTINRGEERVATVNVRFPSDSTLQVTGVESLIKGIQAEIVSSEPDTSNDTEIRITVTGDAPVGSLAGEVRISTTSPNKPVDAIIVVAHIQGEITVQPRVLSGVFRSGDTKAIRSLSLTKRGRKDLKIEKVEEDTGRFTTKIVEVKKGEHYRIELVLKKDAKPGWLQGKLKIHTNHSDQRVIKVSLSGIVQE